MSPLPSQHRVVFSCVLLPFHVCSGAFTITPFNKQTALSLRNQMRYDKQRQVRAVFSNVGIPIISLGMYYAVGQLLPVKSDRSRHILALVPKTVSNNDFRLKLLKYLVKKMGLATKSNRSAGESRSRTFRTSLQGPNCGSLLIMRPRLFHLPPPFNSQGYLIILPSPRTPNGAALRARGRS